MSTTKYKLEGPLTRATVREKLDTLETGLTKARVTSAAIDLASVTEVDSSAVAGLLMLKRRLDAKGISVTYREASAELVEAMGLYHIPDRLDYAAKPTKESVFVKAGQWGYDAYHEVVEFLVVFVDMLYWSARAIIKPRLLRKGAVVEQSIRIGSESLLVVGLISFLIGIVLALQAAFQLVQFGAEIYIANMISVAMFTEMGPLMTAILIAGRIGSAIASEIATMVISEEIDALKTMGINPMRYVVAPKFIATTLTMPLLAFMASVLGVLGGLVISTLYLRLGVLAYFHQMFLTLTIHNVVTGIIKSFAFGWIVVSVGAYVGFGASGGAEGVGKATTRSVVVAIFMVMVADALFSFVFY